MLDLCSVIAEALRGKRIAITGSTGFVGTALVERLLRSVPDCELVLLVRDGRRTTAAQRVQRELLRNDAFDRLRHEHGDDGFRQLAERRITTISGDVGRDGLALSAHDRQLLASCDTVVHSAATVSFDSPLDSAVEINLLGPMRVAALLTELGVTPHLVSVSTCYVAGNRRGNAPEELVSAGPVRPRPELARRGRRGTPVSQRQRSGQQAAQPAGPLPRRCPARARSRRRSGAGCQDRAPARALGARPARGGGSRPCGERRLARRLRLHQGARRTGADRHTRRRPGEHRASVHHRVGMGRAAPGLDPWLPHGRARHPLLRPRRCCASSPACPKVSSTSFPSTSSSPPSSPSPPSARRRHRRSCRWHREARTR